jgi:hypothetical protein
VSWRLYFRSRAWPATVAVAVIFELSLSVWGSAAVLIRHDPTFMEAVPVAVLAQIVPVMLITYTVSSAHADLEFGAARALWPWRLAGAALAGGATATAAVVPCLVIGQTGTLSRWAPVTGFAGLLGIALLASLIIDRRLAGLFALVPVLAPMATDPNTIPGAAAWSFLIPGDGQGGTSPFVLGWSLAGIIAVALAPRLPLRLGRVPD